MIDIGKTLSDARQKRRISIEDLAQTIGTFPAYLEAIEKNQFNDLPIKETPRLIKAYAKMVDENEDALLLEYAKWMSQNPASSITRQDRPAKKGLFQKKTVGSILLTVFAILIVAIVLNLTFEALKSKDKNKEAVIQSPEKIKVLTTEESTKAKETEAKKTETPVKEEVKKEDAKPKTPAKKEVVPEIKLDQQNLLAGTQVPVTLQSHGKAMKLNLKATNGACWFQVLEDGRSIYQDTLNPQKEVSIPIGKNAQNVLLQLGAASYAVIQVNNQKFPDLKAIGPQPITFDIAIKK